MKYAALPGPVRPSTLLLAFLLLGAARSAPAGNVYVVLSSDTSIWSAVGGISHYENEFIFDVFSRPDAVLGTVFDPSFRAAHTDSAGQPFKVSWFMLNGAYFTTGINTNSISTTFLIRRFWEPRIVDTGDEIAYHFHHYDFTGSEWVMADTFMERAWDFDWAFSQALIDESIYYVSFRSGWNYIDTPYENYLEPWIPFRMEGGGWMPDYTPYHPSFDDYRLVGDMKGWEARHIYMKSFTVQVANRIFDTAAEGRDQVVCIWSHQNENDYAEQIESVDQVLHWAWADHPDVPFFYLTAREAMDWYQEGLAPTALSTTADSTDPSDESDRSDLSDRIDKSDPTNKPNPSTRPGVFLPLSSAATTETIVADNDDGPPTYLETGTWTTSGSTGYDGGTYRYASAGTAATATWNVVIPAAGYYDMSAAFLQSTNRVDHARFVFQTSEGNQEVFVNQNGSQELVDRFMGRFLLDAGPTTVTLDALHSESSTGQVVISDAILFRWAPEQEPLPEDNIVVDNDAGAPAYTETGTWTTSTSTGYNGGMYRYVNAGTAATATWSALISRPGYYDVHAAFLRGTNRVELARYILHSADGDQAYYVNQNGEYTVVEPVIGRARFDMGVASVTLDGAGSIGYLGTAVISDAVIFRWADPQEPLPSPTPTPSPTPSPTPPPTVTPLPPLTAAPPPLQLLTTTRDTRTTVTVISDPDIYPLQPWVAARTYAEEYIRLETVSASAGKWVFSYDNDQVDNATVGVCDAYGNTNRAEVRDGSRRITSQSEFYRCAPWNIDFMTNAGRVTLAETDAGARGGTLRTSAASYASSGTLLYEFDAGQIVTWTGARLEVSTPAGTLIRTRYRFANRADDLSAQPWTEYFDTPDVDFPDSPAGRFVQCEIRLDSDSTATPVLDSFEILYVPSAFPQAVGVILF